MDIIMKNINYNNSCGKIGKLLTILDELPYDILLHILSYLNPTELCNLSMVCKEFKTLSEDDWIWRGFYSIIKFNFCFHFQLNQFPKQLESRNSKNVYIQESTLINSVSKFIGVWSEKWCDVDVLNSTKISFNGYSFNVEYTKNKFEAEFISFNGTRLQFKLTGGDSGWSFLYTLSLINNNNNNNCTSNNQKSFFNQDIDQSQQQDILQLHVLRIHDNIEFTGLFCSSKSDCNNPPAHFRNKNNYKLYLLKQQQQQQQVPVQPPTATIIPLQLNNTSINTNINQFNITQNYDDQTLQQLQLQQQTIRNSIRHSHDNASASCDSRRQTKAY